jgi:rfaE bifunctional protein kinase chain/domain
MSQLAHIDAVFERFGQMNVLVVGDIMLDSYIWGKVDRISPEAPVPVVLVERREDRLGGAANVALNLKALGANVHILAGIGNDSHAIILKELLTREAMNCDGLMHTRSKTTVKTRIIGNAHHLLRLDEEITEQPNAATEIEIIEVFKRLIGAARFDAVIFEDYDKGFLSERIIAELVAMCKSAGIKTAVDPKKRNFRYYRNVTLFKPNLKEIKEGLNIAVSGSNIASLEQADQELRKALQHENTLLTLSENGVYYSSNGISGKHEAHFRQIVDVSGAGDTVISVATLCMAAGLSMEQTAQWSNIAGGLACERVGVVPVNREQLREEIVRLVTQS